MAGLKNELLCSGNSLLVEVHSLLGYTSNYFEVRACLTKPHWKSWFPSDERRNYSSRIAGDSFTVRWMTMRRMVCVIAVLCSCFLAVPARAQQQQEPEDPENEKQFGLWLDQGISTGLSANKSLEVEFYERFDEGASNLFEYFVQGGVAFRLRPWVTLIPIYRYQRYPGNPTIDYENRLQLNVTLGTSRGPWRPNLRTLIEGRFPDDRPASARLRFRPGVDYTLPFRMARPPVLVVNNEFFIVPGYNPFANGGSSYTQNRFQVGVRFPITDSFSVRPYYLFQSVNLPAGWETNEIVGFSLAFKVPRKTK
jgi:Protein of unknown function (DUF2490)